MKQRLIRKLSLMLGFGLLVWGLAQFETSWLEPAWYNLLLYFSALGLTLWYVEGRLSKILHDQKPLVLLAVLAIHLFGSLLLAILWRLWGPAYDLRFVLNFFAFYVVFLVFEVQSLLYILRPLSNEPQ
jgi:hypothetical protein